MLYADADSYVWRMWKKISNPSTRHTAFTYLILTRGQRRRCDVDNSSTAGKFYGRTLCTKFFVCRFVLFHPLCVYTSFGFYPEYCVSRWNAVGVSLIWYMRRCGDRLQLSLRIVVLLLIVLCAFSWITWHATVYVQQTCTFPEEGDTYNRKLR